MGSLFLLLPALALLELTGLVLLGRRIGFLNTLSLTLLTAVLGAHFAKREGFRVLAKSQSELAQGRQPSEGVMDGLLVLLGGALLVLPGLLSDVMGIALLVPWTRHLLRGLVGRWLASKLSYVATSAGPFANTAFYTSKPRTADVRQQRRSATGGIVETTGEDLEATSRRSSAPQLKDSD